MSEAINHDRRRFLGTAVVTIAAAGLVMTSIETLAEDKSMVQQMTPSTVRLPIEG